MTQCFTICQVDKCHACLLHNRCREAEKEGVAQLSHFFAVCIICIFQIAVKALGIQFVLVKNGMLSSYN